MKGYIVNSKCYVFPQEVGQIPAVEADVIYVQEENFAAWLAANEGVADKLKKYNYNVMTVNPKEWAGHTNDDLEPAQKEDPELAWSAESATAQIGETNTFPTLTNPHSVTVSYSSSDTEKATINASTGEITLLAEGNTTISAAFAGDDTYEAQTVTYTLTVQAAAPTYYTITKIGDASEYISAPTQAEANDTVTVTLTDGENYTFDLSNKQKQRIMFSADYILASEYYDAVNDQFNYPMPSENQNIDASFKTGYTLTATIDGTSASIEDLNVIVDIFDNNLGADITDLTDVFGGDSIQMNVKSGYTFDTTSTEATIVTAELNGTEIEGSEAANRLFTMPSENSTLAITLTTPQL